MPNTRSQELAPTGEAAIVATDARSWSVTPAALLAHFALQVGTRLQRRALTLAIVRTDIQTALGAEQVPSGSVTVDFDDATGRVTQLEVVS